MKDPNLLTERWRPKSRWEKWQISWKNDPASPWKKWAMLILAAVLLFGLPVALVLTLKTTGIVVGLVVIVAIVAGLWSEPPEA